VFHTNAAKPSPNAQSSNAAPPSLKGKLVCKTHGGRSTGPKTEAGRQRCAKAKTIHGRETRSARRARSKKIAELQMLEEMGRRLGFIVGPKSRGPKCKSKF